MIDQEMKRRPLEGNARSLEPDTQLSKNIVNEALVARVSFASQCITSPSEYAVTGPWFGDVFTFFSRTMTRMS